MRPGVKIALGVGSWAVLVSFIPLGVFVFDWLPWQALLIFSFATVIDKAVRWALEQRRARRALARLKGNS